MHLTNFKLIHGELLKRQPSGAWILFSDEDRAINIYECDGEWIAKRPLETPLAKADTIEECVVEVLTHYYYKKVDHYENMAKMFRMKIECLKSQSMQKA
jgi:hypothetical protein